MHWRVYLKRASRGEACFLIPGEAEGFSFRQFNR